MGYNDLSIKTKKFAVKRLLVPFLSADPAPIQALSALTSFWWGLAIVMWGENLPLGSFVHALHSYAPLWLWGVIFFVVGFGITYSRIAALHIMERRLMLISASLWTYVAVVLLITTPASLAVGTYALFPPLNIWSYWRLRYYE